MKKQPAQTTRDSSKKPLEEVIVRHGRFGPLLPMTPIPELLRGRMNTNQVPSPGFIGPPTQVPRIARKRQPILPGLLIEKRRVIHRPGNVANGSGIFLVIHAPHGDEGQIIRQHLICLEGMEFPSCTLCGADVRFQLIQAYAFIANNEYFKKFSRLAPIVP